MAKLYTGARMTTATTGAGTITLGAAVSGYLTFALAGVVSGDSVYYGIKDGANSEWGTGTYTAAGTTLTRNVTSSTNAGAAISLSGSAEVFIAATAESQGTPGAGLFSFVASTQVKFAPFNGERVKINGLWYDIPSGGITAANTGVFVNGTGSSNLAASTLYYVYLFSNAGTLTIDFSTTAHTTSATAGNVGTEIKSSDDTRSLIGMIRTNGSSQFVSTLLLTWFNRSIICVPSFGNFSGTTTSTSNVALATTKAEILCWANEAIGAVSAGQANTSNSSFANIGIAADGVFTSLVFCDTYTYTSTNVPFTVSGWQVFAEGYHYFQSAGSAQSGSGTLTTNNGVMSLMTKG